ncbi:MAG: helix-turn-helix domain-containing protein [Chloroflexi bacterium]|nr:helix-turn-helix domain-containing protein [Chloroflexota bacterium]
MSGKTKEERITVREAAKECGRNMETIRRWIWSGKLPAEKLGNQLFIKRGDLSVCQPEKERLSRSELFKSVELLREKIRARVGEFDAAELVRESRERRHE